MRKRNERIVSFEQARALSEFDILAFSISFETDYLNVISMLRMAGILTHVAPIAPIATGP